MITVDEFMTSEPLVLRETDTLDDAIRVLSENNIRHIPVTDGKCHVIGLVTQRDVLAASSPGQEAANVCLSEVMIRNVHVIQADDSLRRAAMFMQAHKYGCLPVVTGDRLAGIITDTDFVAIAINLLEQSEISADDADMSVDLGENLAAELTDVAR